MDSTNQPLHSDPHPLIGIDATAKYASSRPCRLTIYIPIEVVVLSTVQLVLLACPGAERIGVELSNTMMWQIVCIASYSVPRLLVHYYIQVLLEYSSITKLDSQPT